MRLVIARCSVDYTGRLSAHLPLATRLLLVKAGVERHLQELLADRCSVLGEGWPLDRREYPRHRFCFAAQRRPKRTVLRRVSRPR